LKRAALLATFGLIVAVGAVSARPSAAQTGPTLVDPALRLTTVFSGLALPTSIAFLGENDLLVLEKDTGRVVRVTNGVDRGAVLDLSVNNFSERGLLGIALHPEFPANPGVYLYWTCRSTAPLDDDPFTPEERECSDSAMFGPDTSEVLRVPLLGNRVDRFVWDGLGLTFERRLTTFLAFQNDGAPDPPDQGDAAQIARGNHDGGVIAFGPDGKLTSS
jgi:glucose/arabinose dehydrogenase